MKFETNASKNFDLFKESSGYVLASAFAFGVDLGLFSFVLRILALPWWLAATLGFMAGVAVAYWLSVRWVFSHRRLRGAPLQEFSAFASIGIIGLVITQAVLWLGIELMRFNPEASKTAAAGVTLAFNFVLRKWLLFKPTRRIGS
jgi:putative flippase GtrA